MNRKLISWVLATTIILATLAVAVQPASSAVALKKTALTINAPGSVHLKQSFAINGKLIDGVGAGIDDMKITVYKSTDGKKWTAVGTCLTGGGGYYSFTTSESAPGSYLYKASFDSNRVFQTSSSAKVTVNADSLIATSLTLTTDKTTIFNDQFVHFKANLSDISGTPLVFKWVNYTLTTATGQTASGAALTNIFGNVDFPIQGSPPLTFVTTFNGDSSYASATSNTIQIGSTPLIPTTTTLDVNPTTINNGDTVTFTGIVTDPNGVGVFGHKIRLELWDNTNHFWNFFGFDEYTDGAGTYNFTRIFVEPVGTYQLRAASLGTDGYDASFSNVVEVTVT